MKQLLTVFVLVAGLVLGAFGSVFAGGSSFEALFQKQGADTLTFYGCEGTDGSCPSLVKTYSFIFARNGQVAIDRNGQRSRGAWKAGGQRVTVKEADFATTFELYKDQFLSYCHEESGDILMLKLAK